MALVNGGFLHYTDMKFIKNLFLLIRWSDFEIISQECSLGDLFQILFTKFLSVHKHGSGEWGLFAPYRHEEILKKSSILQESEFDISGRLDCPIRAVIATGKLPSPFVSPLGK